MDSSGSDDPAPAIRGGMLWCGAGQSGRGTRVALDGGPASGLSSSSLHHLQAQNRFSDSAAPDVLDSFSVRELASRQRLILGIDDAAGDGSLRHTI
jgi:hypothetical protein